MTQQQLADATGQLRTSIANIEAGRQRAPLHVLYLVCAVLNLDLRELLPPMAEVVLDEDQIPAEPVEIPGLEQKIPPLSAALLRKLLRDDEEKP